MGLGGETVGVAPEGHALPPVIRARAWAMFAALAVLWGMPYLFIEIALDDGATPVFLNWARQAAATLVLLPLAWRLGALRGLRPYLRPLIVLTITEFIVPFPLIVAGQQHISSSLAAILIASMPILVALLALRFDADERVQGRRLIGLLVGMAGVVALIGVDVAGRADELLGSALVLLAAIGYAGGTLVVKRHLAQANPFGLVAVATSISAVAWAPIALAAAPPDGAPSAGAIGSILVLGLVSGALGLVLFWALIPLVGASRASITMYLSPVVAVALGVALLGEHIGVGAATGLALILVGSWLSTDGRLPPRLEAVWVRLGARRTARSGCS